MAAPAAESTSGAAETCDRPWGEDGDARGLEPDHGRPSSSALRASSRGPLIGSRARPVDGARRCPVAWDEYLAAPAHWRGRRQKGLTVEFWIDDDPIDHQPVA